MTWSVPPGITGLIFDCDGTLADTMPSHYLAWTTTLGRYGISFPEWRFYQLGGVPTAKIIRILADEHAITIPDLDAVVHEKEQAFLTYLNHVRPITPVVSIASLNRGRMPMAVASGGYRNVVTQTLQHIGVADWFLTMVCAEDTARHKPEPDVFLEAARRIGCEPATCVVFEDTDIGLEAARRAGMLGIDVRPWLSPAAGRPSTPAGP